MRAGSATATATTTGTISSEPSSGGLVGYNYGGSIRNSYAQGSAYAYASSSTPYSRSGGLVGRNGNGGRIKNSYARGSVDCVIGESCTDPRFGGLIGYSAGSGSAVTDSYWDTATTGQSDACDSTSVTDCSGATGLTTAEMQAVSAPFPDGLGDAFQLTDGEYPKLFLCAVCTGTLSYDTELLPEQ